MLVQYTFGQYRSHFLVLSALPEADNAALSQRVFLVSAFVRTLVATIRDRTEYVNVIGVLSEPFIVNRRE